MHVVLLSHLPIRIPEAWGSRVVFGPSSIPAKVVPCEDRFNVVSIDTDCNGLIVGATQRFINALIARKMLRVRQDGDDPMFED